MNAPKTIDALKVQDAYHYALAAADDSDSAFVPRNTSGGTRGDFTRGQYLKMGYRTAKVAGLTVCRPANLGDAQQLADAIRAAALVAGIDANTGEQLALKAAQS